MTASARRERAKRQIRAAWQFAYNCCDSASEDPPNGAGKDRFTPKKANCGAVIKHLADQSGPVYLSHHEHQNGVQMDNMYHARKPARERCTYTAVSQLNRKS
jgi:hypothetical protein